MSSVPELDPQQLAAVVAPRGPVCVLAGAGTGKTRTITRRIAHLVDDGHVRGSQVLAVTFTARAAGEMRSRLRGISETGSEVAGVQALTFHAAALRQLRYFWPLAVGNTRWELIDNKFPLMARAARSVKLDTNTETLRDLSSEIEWAKASLIGPENYPREVTVRRRETPFPAAQVAQVYAAYEKYKVSPDGDMLLDFDDLLLQTSAILETNTALAEEFRERYRCFVVDEYQDVTGAQQQLLNAWLGTRDDLTVVGDANQTIYSFAGATPNYLLEFSRRFPDATVVRLERDYRSTPQVVSLANKVIGQARGRIAGTRLALVGQRNVGPEPQFAEYSDEHAEAAATASAIKKLIDAGTPPAEIAVLYRINAQSEIHEQALTHENIPYQVRGGEAFFQRTEVRQGLKALATVAETEIETTDLTALVTKVLEPIGLSAEPPTGVRARERWESLVAIVNLVAEIGGSGELTLRGFVDELRSRSESRHPPTVQGITLSSIHAAKGLEWDAVFVVGLVDGTLPINQSIALGELAIEEERRLLYVAVTRAREHLYLSWALARNAGGKQSRRRSRFVHSLVPESSPASKIFSSSKKPDAKRAPGSMAASAKRAPRCRVCAKVLLDKNTTILGRCVTCPAHLDENLYVALKQWRLLQSREQKVPAFVVFTDNTLLAIAEQEPHTLTELSTIAGVGNKKLELYGPGVLAVINSKPAGQK